MNKQEEWRDISGYEGLYKVSNLGNVKSIDRWVSSKCNSKKFMKSKMLKQMINSRGYSMVGLSKEGKERRWFVHILVAKAFIPNPNNLPQINHIKEDEKTNNCVENLEWCDCKYNCNYGTRNQKVGKKREQGVKQIDKNTNEVINVFKNALDAAKEISVNVENIHRCCKNKTGTSGGFKWQYV